MSASPPDEKDTDQVTYILDRGLIRFAKFTTGILAIFSVVGIFAFGIDLQAIRSDVLEDRKEVESMLVEIEELRESARGAANDATAAVQRIDDIMRRARDELGNIETTHGQLQDRIRELSGSQQVRLAQRRSENPDDFERGTLWPNGHTLRVKFIGGSADEIAIVKSAAMEWLEIVNLNIEFVDSGTADIRIAFKSGDGSWSYVGTQALAIGNSQPTVNLGYVASDPSSALHEFGHAIGLLHEHQNPLRTFEWDVDEVRAELGGPPNSYSNDTIYEMTLRTWPEGSFAFTKDYDETSIMHFPFPASFFVDGRARSGGSELSETDKEFAARLYPRE